MAKIIFWIKDVERMGFCQKKTLAKVPCYAYIAKFYLAVTKKVLTKLNLAQNIADFSAKPQRNAKKKREKSVKIDFFAPFFLCVFA